MDFISSQMASGGMDSDLVKSIGTGLFSGIGNVLNVASSEAGSEGEETEEETDSEAMKEQVSNVLSQSCFVLLLFSVV